MSRNMDNQPKKRFPLRKSIKLDRVKASDFNNMNTIYCCEQCSFHNPGHSVCTMGFYCKKHEKAHQLALYESTGKMAFCRFMEID